MTLLASYYTFEISVDNLLRTNIDLKVLYKKAKVHPHQVDKNLHSRHATLPKCAVPLYSFLRVTPGHATPTLMVTTIRGSFVVPTLEFIDCSQALLIYVLCFHFPATDPIQLGGMDILGPPAGRPVSP